MGSPEEKHRKRRRIRSHIAKDLKLPKYRQKIKESKKRDVRTMSHRDLVEAIQDLGGDDD